MAEDEERAFGDLVYKAKVRELKAREQVEVSSQEKMRTQPNDLVETRWVLTWKEVDGWKAAESRLVAGNYQDPDLRDGNVDIAGCVSRRSPHLQLISLCALKKWPLWSLEIRNAFLQADGLGREVYLRSARGWNSKDTRRAWKLRTPAGGLNDAPVALHGSRNRCPLRGFALKSPRLTPACTSCSANRGRQLVRSSPLSMTFRGAESPMCCRRRESFRGDGLAN